MNKLNQNTSTLEQILDAVNELPEIDKSKQLITTVTGDGYVHLDDISEVPHDITIEAAAGTKVKVVKNNLFDPLNITYKDIAINRVLLDNGVRLITNSANAWNRADVPLGRIDNYKGKQITVSLKANPQNGNNTYACYLNLKNDAGTSINSFGGEEKNSFAANIPTDTTATNMVLTLYITHGQGAVGYYVEYTDIVVAETENISEVIAPTMVKSYCPNMDFIADSSLTISYNKSWGMNEEYNRFWNGVFSGGNWQSKFVGSTWNDKTFRPNQDIKPTGSANNLFDLCEITDMCKILNDCGVVLDTSGITVRSDNMFNYAIYLTTVPYLDLRNANYSSGILRNLFSNCYELKSIEGIHLAEDGSQVLGLYAFNQCKKLEEVRFYGTIGSNGIDFQHSTKLSRASIESIINALSSTTSGLTVTFSKTAVNNAFTTAEWNALAATKSNWTISLV